MQRKKKGGNSDEDSINSGSDVEMRVKVAPRAERPGRRAASTKKINYSGLSDTDDEAISSDGEVVFKDNDAVKAPTHTVVNITDDDNSEIDDIQSEEEDLSTKKKPTPAKRPRKKVSSSQDSDDGRKKASDIIY